MARRRTGLPASNTLDYITLGEVVGLLASNSALKLAEPVATFRAGLARRNSGTPVKAVFCGSSSTAGTGASDDAHRYVNLLADFIRARYPMDSGSHPTGVLSLSAAVSSPPSAQGFHAINAGVAGTESVDYLTSTTRGQIAALNPRAIFHMIGANDFGHGIAVSSYKANLISQMTAIDTAMGSFKHVHIFLHSYPRFDTAALAAAVAPWNDYYVALTQIAAAYPDTVAVIDTARDFAVAGVTGAAGTDPMDIIGSDEIHMNDYGHRMMAETLRDKVLPAVETAGVVVAPTIATITTTTLGAMSVGTPFSQTIAYTGSLATSATVASGTIPAGLSLSVSSGVVTLSGTPTTATSYTFGVTITNAAGTSAAQSYTVTVAAAGTAPTITTTSLPSLTQGTAMTSTTLAYTGDTVTSITPAQAGTVPAGLTVSLSAGVITVSGAPTGSGAYDFTVRATNATGFDDQQYTGTITASSGGTLFTTDGFSGSTSTDISGRTTDIAAGGTAKTWALSVASTWGINSSGQLVQSSAAGGGFIPITATDYEISVDVVALNNGTVMTTHLMSLDGRRSGLSSTGVNQYRVRHIANGTVGLFKSVSGTETQIGSSTAAGALAAGNNLMLRMQGSTITVLINGTAVITQTDTSVTTSAYAGLSRGTPYTATFDNFKITTL